MLFLILYRGIPQTKEPFHEFCCASLSSPAYAESCHAETPSSAAAQLSATMGNDISPHAKTTHQQCTAHMSFMLQSLFHLTPFFFAVIRSG